MGTRNEGMSVEDKIKAARERREMLKSRDANGGASLPTGGSMRSQIDFNESIRSSRAPVPITIEPSTPGTQDQEGNLGASRRRRTAGSKIAPSVITAPQSPAPIGATLPASRVQPGSELAENRRQADAELRVREGKGEAGEIPEVDSALPDQDRNLIARRALRNQASLAPLDVNADAAGTVSRRRRRGDEPATSTTAAEPTPTTAELVPNPDRTTRFDDPRRANLALAAAQAEAVSTTTTTTTTADAGAGVGGPAGLAPATAPEVTAADASEPSEESMEEMMTHFVHPRVVDARTTAALEAEVVRPVTASRPMNANPPPRLPQDEGIYVGRAPNVGDVNRAKMEHRLRENPKRWLPDGALRIEPDGLSRDHTRAPRLEDDAPKPAVLNKAFVGLATDAHKLNQQYTLKIDAGQLAFLDHVQFREEDLLAKRLHNLYISYKSVKERDLKQYWTQRIKGLKAALTEANTLPRVDPLERSMAEPLAQSRLRASGRGLDDSGRRDANSSFSASGRGADLLASNKSGDDQQRRMEKHRADLRESQRELDRVELEERVLIQEIHETWTRIKFVRQEQHFTATQADLKWQQIVHDATEDELKLRVDIEDRLAEEEELQSLRYSQAVQEYERLRAGIEKKLAAKRERDERNRRRAEAKLRKTVLDAAVEAGTSAGSANGGANPADDEGDDDSDEGEIVLTAEEERLQRPALVAFDPNAARAEIRERLLRARGRPGEPTLVPVFTQSAVMTAENIPAEESTRRRNLAKCHYRVSLRCNNHPVSKTPSKALSWPQCTVDIGEQFVLQIYKWPQELTLEVYASGILDTLLASIPVRLPGQLGSVVQASDAFETYTFKASEPIAEPPWNMGVHVGERYMEGTIQLRAVWGTDSAGVTRSPPPLNAHAYTGLVPDTVAKLKEWAEQADVDPKNPQNAGIMKVLTGNTDLNSANIQIVKFWVRDVDLDPNDPRNAELLALLKSVSDPRTTTTYSVSKIGRELELPDAHLPESLRVKLLRQRETQPIAHNGPIPIEDSQVTKQMFDKPRSNLTKEEDVTVTSQYLRKIREKTKQLKQSSDVVPLIRRRDVSDVVKEVQRPEFNVAFGLVLSVFKPRRRLRPERQKVIPKATAPRACSIHIKVVRGYHIPTRRKVDGAGAISPTSPVRRLATLSSSMNLGATPADVEAGSPLLGETQIPEVSSFVEIRFQGQRDITRVKQGSNPQWNETITLEVRPPDMQFTPENMAAMRDDVYFNLFDQVTITERGGDTVTETAFLGSFALPFSTIYRNSLVQGNFPIEVPVVINGYDRVPASSDTMIVRGMYAPTMLNIYLTLNPPVLVPSLEQKEKIGTIETEEFVRYADEWLNSVKRLAPMKNRDVSALVADPNGFSVFVCRYVRPQLPPPGIDTPEKVLRFVSLVPFVADSAAFAGRQHVWNKSEQFFALLAGDEEEHALQICNFFLALTIEAYVVVGEGVPEGLTAYAMTRDRQGKILFWNGHTGRVYAQDDVHCPLRRVVTVFNEKNMWANIQERDEPWMMTFTLSDKKKWQPFCTERSPPMAPSVQMDVISYPPVDAVAVNDLCQEIDHVLTERLQAWRLQLPTMPRTRFYLPGNHVLKGILSQLELDAQGVKPATEEQHRMDLSRLGTTFRIRGAPINLTFTEMDSLLEVVKNTNVHASIDPEVQFSLGVHVQGYPFGVMSVWIYLVSLTKL